MLPYTRIDVPYAQNATSASNSTRSPSSYHYVRSHTRFQVLIYCTMSKRLTPDEGFSDSECGSDDEVTAIALATPKHHLHPRASSLPLSKTKTPLNHPIESPMSSMLPSVKKRGGKVGRKRRKKSPPANAPLSELTEDEAAHAAAAKQQETNHRLIQEQEKKAVFQQQKVVARAELLKQNDNLRLLSAMRVLRAECSHGGFEFTFPGFVTAALHTTDPHLLSTITKWAKSHGREVILELNRRDPDMALRIALEILQPVLRREGQAIKDLLSRGWQTTLTDMLADFSMEKLSDELQQAAPILWEQLVQVSVPPQQQDEDLATSGRDPTLVS